MTRVVWSALIVVMLVAFATDTFAQPVCHAIRRGESAAEAARRASRVDPMLALRYE